MEIKRKSLGSLAGEIIKDSQKLLSQEVDLLVAEVTQVWGSAKRDVIILTWLAGSFISAILLAALAVVHWLSRYTELPLWTCYGLVAVCYFVVVGVLLFIGRTPKQANLETNSQTEGVTQCLQIKIS